MTMSMSRFLLLTETWKRKNTQYVNGADATRKQIQNCHGDQLPVQPVALMPGAQFPVRRARAGWGPLEAGAEEALEVFGFPFREVFFVHLGLVFDKQIESGHLAFIYHWLHAFR